VGGVLLVGLAGVGTRVGLLRLTGVLRLARILGLARMLGLAGAVGLLAVGQLLRRVLAAVLLTRVGRGRLAVTLPGRPVPSARLLRDAGLRNAGLRDTGLGCA
jgi:hypothetical protein